MSPRTPYEPPAVTRRSAVDAGLIGVVTLSDPPLGPIGSPDT